MEQNAAKCGLPEDYLAELPARIQDARRRVLLSLLPSGVAGSGQDRWWDNHVTHTNEDGATWMHWAGNRWAATAASGGFTVQQDTTARTVTLAFTVQHTAALTGEVYTGCNICDADTEGGTE